MEKKVDSKQYKCTSCGGNLRYEPKEKKLICEKCKSLSPIENNSIITYHTLTGKENSNDENYQKFVSEENIFKCKTCGASVKLDKYEIAKVCPYCGSNLVIDRVKIPGLKPDVVIPFAFDKDKANEIFKEDIKKRFFVPSKFKKNLSPDAVQGIYIPSFGFTGDSYSDYYGELYHNVSVRDHDGHYRTQRKYFTVSGKYDVQLDNIMVESSSKLNQSDLQGVLPYDAKKHVAFDEEYLLGYSVEHYSESLVDCAEKYRVVAKGLIEQQILSKYSYDGVSYMEVKTKFEKEKYLYYLLPVYKFEYEYKNKKYITYMNAQTGKVDKNVPKSGAKIALIVILGLLGLLLPIILSLLLS